MVKSKHSLPRHTNLAKQSSRFTSFIVDFALLGITLIILFIAINAIMKPIALDPLNAKKEALELESHLKYEDEEGRVSIISADANWTEYRDVLSYYYLTYLVDISENKNDLVENTVRKDYYTIDWFNKNILQISEDPDGEHSISLFTYEKNGNEYDKSKLGIPRIGQNYWNANENSQLEIKESTINVFFQERLQEAFLNFQEQDFVLAVLNPLYFYTTLNFVLAALFSSIVVYIVMPLIFKNGQTIGKKLMKIGLANKDGYKFENKQLFMRIMPFSVVILALLLPFWNELLVIGIVMLTIFLVSFALAMASPKKCALHDYVARTIVVDLSTSLIFENEIEEEAYLLKEDNIPVENYGDGEEPEISYEK